MFIVVPKIEKQRIYFFINDQKSISKKVFIEELRAIGGSWSHKEKMGYIHHYSINPKIIELINRWNPFFDFSDYYKFYKQFKLQLTDQELKAKYKLFDPQVEGVKFLVNGGFNKLLADEQGIGKTVQSVVACIEGGFKKVLVITLSGVVYHFIDDIEMFAKDSATGYAIKELTSELGIVSFDESKTEFLIINYESVTKYQEELLSFGFDCIIIDEIHRIKNDKTIWSKFIIELGENIPYSIGLSGTSLPNRPIELYNLLWISNHPLGRDKFKFALKYCGAKHSRFGFDLNTIPSFKTLENLNNELQGFYLRRLISQCYDLPANHLVTYEYEYEPTREYEQLFYFHLQGKEQESLMKRWKSRQLIESNLQLEYLSVQLISTTIDILTNQCSDGKTIIFSSYSKTLDRLETKLKVLNIKYIRLDGEIPDKKREILRLKFQTDPSIRVVLGSTASCSTGITLNSAKYLIWNDLPINPTFFIQGCNRHYRLGQVQETKTFFLIYKNTVIERMYNLLMKKKAVSETVFAVDDDTDDVLSLLYGIE